MPVKILWQYLFLEEIDPSEGKLHLIGVCISSENSKIEYGHVCTASEKWENIKVYNIKV